MALRNGLDHRIPEGLQDRNFLRKPMQRFFAQQAGC
jgi:hypothetical protein